MTQRDNVAQLYTSVYDEFMLEGYAEYSQVHPSVFEVIDDSQKEYKVDDLSGLGEWDSATEGSGGGYEDPVLGYPKTFTQAKYWKKFQTSFESVDQDEYALLKKVGLAREMGIGGRAKVERSTADVFNDGFATACPDGQYLFYDSHPKNREETSTTYDNLLSGALSHDNLEAAESQIANNLVTMTGIPIPPPEKMVLLHPPALRGMVARLLSDRATDQPDTTLRNINRFAGKYDPIEWIWLSNANGGSDTAWYIVFPGLNYFKIIWSARPHFTSWIDEENEYYKFKGRMLFDCGAVNWRGAFGSTGL